MVWEIRSIFCDHQSLVCFCPFWSFLTTKVFFCGLLVCIFVTVLTAIFFIQIYLQRCSKLGWIIGPTCLEWFKHNHFSALRLTVQNSGRILTDCPSLSFCASISMKETEFRSTIHKFQFQKFIEEFHFCNFLPLFHILYPTFLLFFDLFGTPFCKKKFRHISIFVALSGCPRWYSVIYYDKHMSWYLFDYRKSFTKPWDSFDDLSKWKPGGGNKNFRTKIPGLPRLSLHFFRIFLLIPFWKLIFLTENNTVRRVPRCFEV